MNSFHIFVPGSFIVSIKIGLDPEKSAMIIVSTAEMMEESEKISSKMQPVLVFMSQYFSNWILRWNCEMHLNATMQ
jgi:hypothetical protein